MKIINFFLALVAFVALWVLGVPLYLTGVLFSKNRSKYHLNIGITFDQSGGVLGGPLFNLILRKKGGHKFGNPDETISFVLGQNKASGHLTAFGRWCANKLNQIDPKHVEKAKS